MKPLPGYLKLIRRYMERFNSNEDMLDKREEIRDCFIEDMLSEREYQTEKWGNTV